VLQEFCYAVEDTPLFCKSCQGVFLHSLKACKPLRPGLPAAPQEPILMICHHCRQAQVFVASEFQQFSPAPLEQSTFKIAGHNRLLVGDSVYIPGESYTGTIKSRFRTGTQEVFVITQTNGQEIRWTANTNQPYGENALEHFRLIPTAAAETRIGDSIYHTIRQRFGRAVGLLFGKETQLVIQLEDEAILLLSLPETRRIPDNQTLKKVATQTLQESFPDYLECIHLEAGQGILYARGTCHTLPEVMTLQTILGQIPGIRGVVTLLSVQPESSREDSWICEQIHNVLLALSPAPFAIQVDCTQAEATVRGCYRNEQIRLDAQSAIIKIPGLRRLNLELRNRPLDESGDREKSLLVAQALRRNATLKGIHIQIFTWNGVTHLEGLVSSSLQRNAAALAAMWAGRNFRIENLLRIGKSNDLGEPFIRVV